MRFRYVSSLVLVALVAGAIAAHADSAGAPPPARTPARVVAAPAPARTPVRVVAAPAPARTPVRVVAAPAPARPFVGVAPLPIGCAAPVPLDPRRKTPQAPTAATAAPPSQQLLDAFAILRRTPTDQDALSPAALEALRVRGLSPVSLDSSRCCAARRRAGRRGSCRHPTSPAGWARSADPRASLVRARAWSSSRSGCRERWGRGARRPRPRPRTGDGRAVRGRGPLDAVDLGHRANGVPAVFLTAPDGTAVRADVKDNGYEFLLPNQRAYDQRYVVWTGGDGTPHVQPIVTFAAARAGACKSSAKLAQSAARVSPDGAFGCTGAPIANKFAVPVPRRAIADAASAPPGRGDAPRHAVRRGAACSRRASLPPAARSQRLRSRCCGPIRRRRWPWSRPSPSRRPPLPRPRLPASTADHAPTPSSLDEMAAPRPLVILTLLAVFVASVSVTILAWIAIATAHKTQDVVDKADRLTNDAATSIRRLDRTTRDLDPAVRSLRRASDALNNAARATP